MKWQELVADPNLQDLPYKIETNEWGQIVMTPTRNKHGFYQFKIGDRLNDLCKEPGAVVVECAIKTTRGTKVADVAWFSAARWEQVKDEFESSVAPEICVEVLSPGNSSGEIEQKKDLYFEAGAVEVWVCSARGKLRFYSHTGELNKSMLVPKFPKTVTE